MTTKNRTVFPQEIAIPETLEIHPSVSPKAAALLEGVIEVLMKTPEEYKQQRGFIEPECGAACCILGHMEILLNGRPKWFKVVSYHNPEAYGLTQAQAFALYKSDHWPMPWRTPSDVSPVSPAQGIARIEHFLKTGA